MASLYSLYVLTLFCVGVKSQILCENGFCRSYGFDVGCTAPSPHCRINNETHTGIWLPSPTTCNCCDYCLPFIAEGDHCSLGGPGTGTTVGRCGDGLTCVQEEDGNFCRRMESECHSAQDEYDSRHELGQIGSLEQRPGCDGKGRYRHYYCVPTQTCFCQSDEGERLFGEVLHQGAVTERNMHCGCSRLHHKIQQSISPGVPLPVVGLRCTSDGNFNPMQCLNNTCYCVDEVTGAIKGDESINLEIEPLSELPCYDADLDLFPSIGLPPYNYTSPCLESMKERIAFLEESEQDGFNVDFFSSVPECLPDATFGRVVRTSYGSKICVDERGEPIEKYEAMLGSPEFDKMNCNCAQTELLMATQSEKPVCCQNGNFRKIQCRRGACRCVDSDGRQVGVESNNLEDLSCYNANEDWRNYDADLDLFPSIGLPPYNYTSPCLESMKERIAFLEESEQDGFNVDFFSSVPECLPDATFGRVVRTSYGSKICVDERGEPIEKYEAMLGSPEFDEMNCNCAQTELLMATQSEKPVCCQNGNFRKIQCRRGACRCVDSDGRQVGVESNNLEDLSCYNANEDWRNC